MSWTSFECKPIRDRYPSSSSTAEQASLAFARTFATSELCEAWHLANVARCGRPRVRRKAPIRSCEATELLSDLCTPNCQRSTVPKSHRCIPVEMHQPCNRAAAMQLPCSSRFWKPSGSPLRNSSIALRLSSSTSLASLSVPSVTRHLLCV